MRSVNAHARQSNKPPKKARQTRRSQPTIALYPVRRKTMKLFLMAIVLIGTTLHAEDLEGLWQGYDGEGGHVSRQMIALAGVTPAQKFTWRPAPGVRSMSEVYMHIALANFYLLSVTGPKMPGGIK